MIMGVPILTTNSTLLCPHGGSVILQTSNVDMKIQSAPALLVTDLHTVAGCPFFIGLKPSPCLTVRWAVPASQASVHGTPVLLQSSVGLCYSPEQAPQGLAIVVQVQPIALGS
jgi:hypothetical protein